VDTLKAFKKRFPNNALVLILGADNLLQFHSWKSPETILRLASLAVYKRKGFHRAMNNATLSPTILKGPLLQLSSTEIRNKIKRGGSIQTLVPNSILHYIKQHSLYLKPTPIFPKR
jgi:nicotinate-nucleotide adenylyltransferase